MTDADIIKRKEAEVAFFKDFKEMCKKHPDVEIGECYEYNGGQKAELHIWLCEDMITGNEDRKVGRSLEGIIRCRENDIADYLNRGSK